MNIRQKVDRAYQASVAVYARQPNVLYVGNEEALDLRLRREGDSIMGMRVIQVRLDSWLQCTYVEGVK